MILEYILTGITVGIFEWLPLSSETIRRLLGIPLSITLVDFALLLHAGTLLATIIYFRSEIKTLLRKKNKRLLHFLIISTVVSLPIAYLGYLFLQHLANGSLLLGVVGAGLLINSIAQKQHKKLEHLSDAPVAVITGVLQGLSVIPGLPRVGATIFGLSLGSFTPRQMLTYSYLMSVPAIIAATAYLMYMNPQSLTAWPVLIASFIASIITLHVLFTMSKKTSFSTFTLIFGSLCIIGALLATLL